MIDREQVQHVARLARLRLDDAEEEQMSEQLSGILEHVEKISSLQLDSVEPTTHVVSLSNRLRDDEPVEGPSRESLLESAPDVDEGTGGFEVPSPQA